MLDRIRDVNFGAVDPGFIEGRVKNLTCGAHERPPFYVFPITGLLSDEYYFSTLGTLSEDGLGGVFPQIACLAGLASAPNSVNEFSLCLGSEEGFVSPTEG